LFKFAPLCFDLPISATYVLPEQHVDGRMIASGQRWLGLFEQFPGLSKWSLCRG
jgi:hypothetical protein